LPDGLSGLLVYLSISYTYSPDTSTIILAFTGF